MIQSIKIKNFQSHKNTELTFSPGVNVITGPSDSGKTAILRSILWNRYNRPTGLSIISKWNRDNKNNPLKQTYVELQNDSIRIRRIRGTREEVDFNGYLIWDKDEKFVLDAIGMSVPEEVERLLNINEVNIQEQMDRPFLLSETSGEIAKLFNQTIRLDIIDKVLSKAKSEKNDINKSIRKVEAELEEVKKSIEELSWVDDALEISNKIDKLEKSIEDRENDIDDMKELVEEYYELEEGILEGKKVLSAVPMIQEIENIITICNERENTISRMKEVVDEYESYQKIIGIADFIEISNYIDKINEFRKELYEKIQRISKAKELAEEYNSTVDEIEECKEEVKKLEKMLPKICPVCGKPLEG